MKPLLNQYNEVRALLQLHILQNYSLPSKIAVEPDLHSSYLNFVKNKNLVLGKPTKNVNNRPLVTSFQAASPNTTTASPSPLPSTPISPSSSKPPSTPSSTSSTPSSTPSSNSSTPSSTSQTPSKKTNTSSPKPKSSPSKILPQSSKLFSLISPPASPPTSFTSTKQTFNQLFPQVTTLANPPEDTAALELFNKSSFNIPPVVLLSFEETGETYLFLENLSKAINDHLVPSRVISCEDFEKKHKWETLYENKNCKLILGTKNTFKAFTVTQDSTSTPLYQLENILNYINKPSLKRELWNYLTEKLKTK